LAEFLVRNREGILLGLACSAVLFPLVVAFAFGHIPRQVLARWAVPLAAATLLLAVGIRFLERTPHPLLRLSLYVLFGLIWTLAGVRAAFFGLRGFEGVSHGVVKTSRAFGFMFLLFGLSWIGVSFFQFLRG